MVAALIAALVLGGVASAAAGAQKAVPATDAGSLPPFRAYPMTGVDVRGLLAAEPRPADTGLRISGVVTPHHLVAADLIARVIAATGGNSYDRIILLSPDHFFKSPRPAATTRRSFETAYGRVESDSAAARQLLQDETLFAESDLFQGEHGILGLLPFLKLVHPHTPVVAITLGIGTSRAEWDRIVAAIDQVATPRTLIVQSTDFSHYLRPHEAQRHDQETLNALATGDPAAIERLNEPHHLDSRAATYVQMSLQHRRFGAQAVVVANRTAFDYIPIDEATTSYVAALYAPDPVALARLRYGDQQVYYFGGDVFVGRHFTPLAADEAVRAALVAQVRAITDGAPLVVNLEGAVLEEMPQGLPAGRHVMFSSLAGPMMKAMNVVAASRANNHSFDAGPLGVRETERLLKEVGIASVGHLGTVDLGAVRVVAVNYVGVGDYKGYPAARVPEPGQLSDTEALCRSSARPPLVALVHWGEEYTDTLTSRERAIAADLQRCGVAAVIGAHSHRASRQPVLTAGGDQVTVVSVGNLIFDQFSPASSGALVELRVFRHGTFALRLVPLPNLYEEGRALRRAVSP